MITFVHACTFARGREHELPRDVETTGISARRTIRCRFRVLAVSPGEDLSHVEDEGKVQREKDWIIAPASHSAKKRSIVSTNEQNADFIGCHHTSKQCYACQGYCPAEIWLPVTCH